MRALLFASLLAVAPAGLSAQEEAAEDETSEAEKKGGETIGAGGAQSAGGAGLGSDDPRKPKPQGSGGVRTSGGGGGAARALIMSGGGAHGGGGAAEAKPGDDWLHTDSGPDTPARHRRTAVQCDFVSKIDTNHETIPPFCSVINGDASCYHASKIFLLWQQWHFRRMNRVADNAVGCPNVPATEQGKIVMIQARNQAMFDEMDRLAAAPAGFDVNCDAIIKVYRDGLDWNTLAMFFKGRYMARCAAASTVGEDWWPRPPCGPDPATGKEIERVYCAPPLPPL